jgi:small-conductance mechanosensitive channel
MPLLNQILGIAVVQAQSVTEKAGDVATGTGNELTKLIGNFIASIPLWIAAIVIGFFSYVLAVGVKKALESKLTEQGIEEEHKEVKIVAGRSAFFGVLVIGITVSLSIVGIDLKPIVAAGAFGLGFALQDIIMNLISGMFILASRHYTIGDVISMGSVVGRIEEIQTRATIIKAFDGTKVIVPNSELFSNVVISKTSNPYRKLSFIQGVGYGTDLKMVMELTLAVVNSIPWVLKKPKASVIFTEWDDSWINFKINVWIDSKGGKFVKVKNRVMMDLTKAYEEAGIYIPYPIQTVQFENTPKGFTEDEIDQDSVSKKMKELKLKYKTKALAAGQPGRIGFSPVQMGSPLVSPLVPAMAGVVVTASPAPATLADPNSVSNLQPGIVAPVLPEAPAALPTAIETTANSPGQSWLQQALTQQVAAVGQPVTAPAVPLETVTAPVASGPAVSAPVEIAPAAVIPQSSAPVVTAVTPSAPLNPPAA